ncbi:hypothetical protein [Halomonas huangheensis]|uniref:Uncharacterized protein n=1 Tax=Halomonas huangheensis TaxID=1178482 RepID=W1N634_9GAMM|nr:hypothetical protein [Halomonas huangheensis]ALM50892.1 hypothetical protein AR456_00215 [Halomonas huangheensis]ERL51037.1 hypothetical protein BJB45_20815 [Halomonas huangheensis]
MSQRQSNRLGALLLTIASLVGLAIALYAWFTPLTGVNGTLGALVAILACLALAIMAFILPRLQGGVVRNLLRIVILLGLIGTGFAGLLLHQCWISAAMLVGLVGLILDIACSNRTSLHAHS